MDNHLVKDEKEVFSNKISNNDIDFPKKTYDLSKLLLSIILTLLNIVIIIIVLFFIYLKKSTKNENKIFKLKLIPKADFIQPWFCGYWTVEEWQSHFEKLILAGFDELIIQGSISITDNNIVIHYPSPYFTELAKNLSLSLEEKTFMYSRIFEALDKLKKTFKISIGLTMIQEWNYKSINDPVFYEKVLKYEKNCLREILTTNIFIKNLKYISSIYIVQEMYDFNLNKDYENGTWYESDLELSWAKYINEIITYLETNFKNVTMPIFLSPYHSAYYNPSKNTEYRVWRNFFSKANMRKIDAIAPQDFFGSAQKEYNEEDALKAESHLMGFMKACKEYSKAQFWINIELFYPNGTNLYTASVERIKKQFEIADKFDPEKIITFSYSHYGIDKEPFNTEYINMINERIN